MTTPPNESRADGACEECGGIISAVGGCDYEEACRCTAPSTEAPMQCEPNTDTSPRYSDDWDGMVVPAPAGGGEVQRYCLSYKLGVINEDDYQAGKYRPTDASESMVLATDYDVARAEIAYWKDHYIGTARRLDEVLRELAALRAPAEGKVDALLDALVHAVRSHERSPDKYTAQEITDARKAIAALAGKGAGQ